MSIGEYTLKLPLDWSIVICDPEIGEPEVVSITALNDRGLQAFVYNPLTGFMPTYEEVNITNIFTEVRWHFPKLKYGHILAVPLGTEKSPPCIFIVKDTNKIPEVLDISQLW